MWYPFKKKTFEEKMEGLVTLNHRSEEFELGKTYINITFDDGRECSTPVYGTFRQMYGQGHRSTRDRAWVEAFANPPYIRSSRDVASDFICNLQVDRPIGFPNDPRKVESVMAGRVTDATIGDTESYKETHLVAYALEPK